MSAEEQRRLLALLRTLNPGAEIIPTRHSEVPLSRVINTGRFSFEQAQQNAGWLQVSWDGGSEMLEDGVGGGQHGQCVDHGSVPCWIYPPPSPHPSPPVPLQSLNERHTPETEEYDISSIIYR